MDSSKLASAGIRLTEVHDAVTSALAHWKRQD
jgi:hypothetical protein